MRHASLIPMAIGLICACPGAAAAAEPPTGAHVCLRLIDNVRMQAIDDYHVIFVQRNGTTWESELPHRCLGISVEGFGVRSPDGNICGDSEILGLLRSGNICRLGPLVQVPAAPKS